MKTLVVIPVYGEPQLTQRCLDSIKEPVDLFVVDNRGDYKRQRGETVYSVGRNLGWLASCNAGLRYSAAEKYDHCVLLNNDVTLSERFFDGLLRPFQLFPDVGMTVPKYNGRMSPTQRVEGPFSPKETFEDPKFVDGTCLCLSLRAFACVGELDPVFEPVGWGAEVDYCIRLRNASFRVIVSGLSYLHHADAATASILHGSRDNYQKAGCKNAQAAFEKKYGPTWRERIPITYSQ